MSKQDLVIGALYWTDGNALKTNKATLKYVGKKYVIVESINGNENWHTLDFFLEWATEA
jgi:hypothetical protein